MDAVAPRRKILLSLTRSADALTLTLSHREREKNNRTKPTILSRFFSKNESLLAIRFNSFIKIPAPEILPS
ncbi:hypothetical protein F1543_06175 [Enterobacter cloacae]|uniref:hypothetical protein n=1 Tax=Enterobacter cloacae TaxID=550 RepID=UPI000FD7834A|nr:hypothetical protein F1543_06175 [Enterobacter cloacae]HAS1960738.1 hypothetical protein [Enterobacter cloacae]